MTLLTGPFAFDVSIKKINLHSSMHLGFNSKRSNPKKKRKKKREKKRKKKPKTKKTLFLFKLFIKKKH